MKTGTDKQVVYNYEAVTLKLQSPAFYILLIKKFKSLIFLCFHFLRLETAGNMVSVVGFSLCLLIVCLCFNGSFAAVFDVTNFGARADGRTDDTKVS